MGRKSKKKQQVSIVKFPWGDPEGLVQGVRSLLFKFGPLNARSRMLLLGRGADGYGVFCYTMNDRIDDDLHTVNSLNVTDRIVVLEQNAGTRTIEASSETLVSDPATQRVIDAFLCAFFGCSMAILGDQSCRIEFGLAQLSNLQPISAEAAAYAS